MSLASLWWLFLRHLGSRVLDKNVDKIDKIEEITKVRATATRR